MIVFFTRVAPGATGSHRCEGVTPNHPVAVFSRLLAQQLLQDVVTLAEAQGLAEAAWRAREMQAADPPEPAWCAAAARARQRLSGVEQTSALDPTAARLREPRFGVDVAR